MPGTIELEARRSILPAVKAAFASTNARNQYRSSTVAVGGSRRGVVVDLTKCVGMAIVCDVLSGGLPGYTLRLFCVTDTTRIRGAHVGEDSKAETEFTLKQQSELLDYVLSHGYCRIELRITKR